MSCRMHQRVHISKATWQRVSVARRSCRLPPLSQHPVRSVSLSQLTSTDTQTTFAELLQKFDSDEDGKLTYAEAEALLYELQLGPQNTPTSTCSQLPDSRPTTVAASSSTPTPTYSTTSFASTNTTAATATSNQTPPKQPPAKPLTWELQLIQGALRARQSGTRLHSALSSFVSSKLANQGNANASCSDLVWSFLGMFVFFLALGVLNVHAKSLPVVGQWHEQGLGVLLGSFGTLGVVTFARPESEPIRMWNLLAGHVFSICLVMVLLSTFGPGIWSRAFAMAASLGVMLWTDSVHPPGGALVLMAVDSAAIQEMKWWFLLYPSLTITFVLLLPLGAAVNWLKRNVVFDFPSTASRQFEQDWKAKTA